MTAPHPSALAPEDLERLTGYKQQADIEKWCQKNGIRVFRSRAGVWIKSHPHKQANSTAYPSSQATNALYRGVM